MDYNLFLLYPVRKTDVFYVLFIFREKFTDIYFKFWCYVLNISSPIYLLAPSPVAHLRWNSGVVFNTSVERRFHYFKTMASFILNRNNVSNGQMTCTMETVCCNNVLFDRIWGLISFFYTFHKVNSSYCCHGYFITYQRLRNLFWNEKYFICGNLESNIPHVYLLVYFVNFSAFFQCHLRIEVSSWGRSNLTRVPCQAYCPPWDVTQYDRHQEISSCSFCFNRILSWSQPWRMIETEKQ